MRLHSVAPQLYSIYCQTVVQIKDILANLSRPGLVGLSLVHRKEAFWDLLFSTHSITDARGAVCLMFNKKKLLSTVEQTLPPPPSSNPSGLLMKLCQNYMAYHPSAPCIQFKCKMRDTGKAMRV